MAPRDTRGSERIVAFIDLGTNAVRLLLVRILPNHAYRVITVQKETVRLGEGEFQHRHLQTAAMDRALLVSKQFIDLASRHHADEIFAVATAATREAENQAEFLHRFHAETGRELHVISGREEARLIYLGVASGIHLDDTPALFLDIGGGSTEISVGNGHEYQFLESLKLGAIRLSQRLPHPERPVSSTRYRDLQQIVRGEAVRALQGVKALPFGPAFGSSGTIENLAIIAMRVVQQREVPRGTLPSLTRVDLQQLAPQLCQMPLDERRKVPGLHPERADIIIGGMAILQTLMEELDIAVITPSDRGLRDGLLVDYLAKMEDGARYADLSVRARSVLRLGRNCGFDEPHAAQTARLALMLFDATHALGLHAFDAHARELLEWAAQLHDIGAFLSYTNHHQHGDYFIRHADLLGFDQREKDIMGATVFFHRKALPRKRDAEYVRLDVEDQALVRVLCVLLRLAESLDRSHAGLVTDVAVTLPDETHLRLTLHTLDDCPLEQWSVRTHAPAVQKLFHRTLLIEKA